MRIMMFTEKDSSNLSLGRIADEFLSAGHEIEIYAPYCSTNVMRMFDQRIPIHPISELNMQSASKFDIIFASPFGRGALKKQNVLHVGKFIFSYDFLVHAHIVNGSDFCFAPSLNNTPGPYEQEMVYSKCGVGEPKFDDMETLESSSVYKKILFIDSGHYPFGEIGRKELARTILKICKHCSGYEIVVKPRFLPDDTVFTHRNNRHLYECLHLEANGVLPVNLTLLKEHLPMPALLRACDTVICLLSTAYLEVMAARKRLLILDNLPSEDVYSPRRSIFERLRNGMLGSGALVDYREATSKLPHGVQPNSGHLERFVYRTKSAAGNISEITEKIHRDFLIKGQYPAIGRYTYSDINQQLGTGGTQSQAELISNRIENYIRYSVLIQFDYFCNIEPDAKTILTPLSDRRKLGFLAPGDEDILLKELNINISREIVSRRAELECNIVDRGFVIKHLYNLGDYDQILKSEWNNCGAEHYFKGKVYSRRGDPSKAIEHLRDYLEITKDRDYVLELTDEENIKIDAFKSLEKLYKMQGNEQDANEAVKMCELVQKSSAC